MRVSTCPVSTAVTPTRAVPGPTGGAGTWCATSTSGPPNRVACTTNMAASSRVHVATILNHEADVKSRTVEAYPTPARRRPRLWRRRTAGEGRA
jgi:hypothetical protein